MHYHIIILDWIHLDEQFLLTTNALTHQKESRIAWWPLLGRERGLLHPQNKALLFP